MLQPQPVRWFVCGVRREMVVIWVNIFQTELMAEIYSKSPV